MIVLILIDVHQQRPHEKERSRDDKEGPAELEKATNKELLTVQPPESADKRVLELLCLRRGLARPGLFELGVALGSVRCLGQVQLLQLKLILTSLLDGGINPAKG